MASVSCAYGTAPPSPEVYGHKVPEEWDGSNPEPPYGEFSGDPAFDPIETGCFQQPVYGPGGWSQPPVGWFWVCDGQGFTVQDLVDPSPDKTQRQEP